MINPMPVSPLAYEPHNHTRCIHSALKYAQAHCRERGVRLTSLRQKVLEMIWQSHKPLGAYALVAMLSEQNKKIVAPPTIYRALDFLLEQGLVHRIASLNAYIGCDAQSPHCQKHFLICQQCHITVELNDPQLEMAIHKAARDSGFAIREESLEVAGLCPNCQRENS